MRKILLFALLPLFAFGTNPAVEYTPYAWVKDRTRYELPAGEKELAEVILKQHVQYDYFLENNQFVMYTTVHHIILVNNNEAIQKHNRIYIPMRQTIELMDVKARAINKDGKVTLFDQSNLKTVNEEGSGNMYKIFAIEGIELGSEVEYYYTRRQGGILYDRTFLQTDALIKECSFGLSCPKHLQFDFKSYNGFAEVQAEKTEDRNTYFAAMKDIQPMKKETFSFFDANRKRIEFKLAYNTARSQSRIYTWDEAAKTFYELLSSRDKDDEKAVEKFVKTLNDKPALETGQRIKNIENAIKGSIQVNREANGKELSTLSSILRYKVASREGMTKLFVAVFEKLGVECQPVITCSRETSKFDGDFDTWSYLDEYVLHFPSTKGFLAPYVQETRYPLIPPDYTAHGGLFIEPLKIGELKSALGAVKQIPAADYAMNTDNLDIAVDFREDMSTAHVRLKREFSGYNASFFVPFYHLMTQEQKMSMIEELTKQTAPDPQIKEWSAKPLEGAIDKFLIDVDFESAHFVEKAGPTILFRAGELIGPQIEMYRDNDRVTEVENDYNRGYDRTIRITIPNGYSVKNLKDLVMDVAYSDNENTPFIFKSNYTQDGNIVTVTITEYYKQIYAPLDRYEDYRKVVNAAADFNKVTLILEKAKDQK